jgi:retron-type reverse transcriptase
MKRQGNLFDSIRSFSALFSASRKARRGKRFRDSTAGFEFNLEGEIIRLERELREKTYRPGPYREFYIYEHKKRKISAAPYRDRVVQHALCAVIEPIIDRSLIHDTYACRAGKGTHKAVDRFTAFSRKFRYALKFDIEKYFPSIDHEILKAKIRRKIKCQDTLWLIDLIIDSSNPQEGPAADFLRGAHMMRPL